MRANNCNAGQIKEGNSFTRINNGSIHNNANASDVLVQCQFECDMHCQVDVHLTTHRKLQTCNHSELTKNVAPHQKLNKKTFMEPTDPGDKSMLSALKEQNQLFKQFQGDSKAPSFDRRELFGLIGHHCAPSFQHKLESMNNCKTIEDNDDVTVLLNRICKLVC